MIFKFLLPYCLILYGEKLGEIICPLNFNEAEHLPVNKQVASFDLYRPFRQLLRRNNLPEDKNKRVVKYLWKNSKNKQYRKNEENIYAG